jgi:hypothetical protein
VLAHDRDFRRRRGINAVVTKWHETISRKKIKVTNAKAARNKRTIFLILVVEAGIIFVLIALSLSVLFTHFDP